MLNVWRTTLDVKPLKYSAVLFIIFALTNTHTHTQCKNLSHAKTCFLFVLKTADFRKIKILYL
jgi:hypothetical protein